MKGTKSKWICIRECYDKNCRVWYVGDVTVASEPPMPRHFERVYSNEQPDPIAVLRRKVEGHGIQWDDGWDIQRLQREIEIAANYDKAQQTKKESIEDAEKIQSGRKADKK
jgi:hypothetical protein